LRVVATHIHQIIKTGHHPFDQDALRVARISARHDRVWAQGGVTHRHRDKQCAWPKRGQHRSAGHTHQAYSCQLAGKDTHGDTGTLQHSRSVSYGR
jgi:hypothetical protein